MTILLTYDALIWQAANIFCNQQGMLFQKQLPHDYNAIPPTQRYIAEQVNSYRTI